MGNLLWEQQAVSQNLALLRSHLDMLDRELPANSESQQQPKNQRGRATLVEEQGREERERRAAGVQRRREEERSHEIRVLRSRLRELESMVGVMEGRGREEAGLGESLEVERSLAMLTAQYEKAGGADCDLEDELNCSLPSGLAVPPPMEQLNNASRVEESVRLARELRARKEQLERLVQKNTFPSNCNELPGEPRREGGRRKETNVAGGHYGVTSGGSQYGVGAGGQFGATTGGGQFSASQQLIRLQHQVRSFHPFSHPTSLSLKVTKLSGELDRLSGLPAVPHPVLQASHPGPTSTATATVSPQPRPAQGCCTAQLQTLSLSLNQVYAALWGLQRELTRTSERVAALEEGRQVSSRQGRPASRESLMSSVTRRDEWPAAAGGEVIWPGVGGTEQSFSASGFQHMSSPSRQNSGAEWGGSVPPWPPHPPTLPPDHHLSPFPSRDLWNSLQASPGFSPLHPGSSMHPPPLHPSLSLFPGAFPQERDSGVSSGALNNQVENPQRKLVNIGKHVAGESWSAGEQLLRQLQELFSAEPAVRRCSG